MNHHGFLRERQTATLAQRSLDSLGGFSLRYVFGPQTFVVTSDVESKVLFAREGFLATLARKGSGLLVDCVHVVFHARNVLGEKVALGTLGNVSTENEV